MGLRFLCLFDIEELHSLEGLANLKNLTHFVWISNTNGMDIHFVGQLPLSLKILIIWGGNVVLPSDVLVQCKNLFYLELNGVEANTLDLSNCGSLESLFLVDILKLQTLSCPSACQPCSLQYLLVSKCWDLVDILGMDHLIGLK